MKQKVGITGNDGFIGYHLTSLLKTKENIEIIPFELDFFYDSSRLDHFVSQCDVIVHLAGVNRHHDEKEIYNVNISLAEKIIDSIKKNKTRPFVIFSSSTQEERDNPYGRAKRQAREMLEKFSAQNHSAFAGLIIPNVFGPFGQPYYNSFIATFCHQINHSEEPKIEIDATVNLIYVFDLVNYIYDVIAGNIKGTKLYVPHKGSDKVSSILQKLNSFKEVYLKDGIIPDLKNDWDICLFNTFRSYIDYDFYPFKLQKHEDNRGYLFEVLKSNTKGQIFCSSTKKGITRGNHFHFNKIERFCVVKGQAEIKLRKIGTSEIITYKVNGEDPSFVDIPLMHTHNITNTGESELVTLFWTNEFYNPDKPDTYYEEV